MKLLKSGIITAIMTAYVKNEALFSKQFYDDAKHFKYDDHFVKIKSNWMEL